MHGGTVSKQASDRTCQALTRRRSCPVRRSTESTQSTIGTASFPVASAPLSQKRQPFRTLANGKCGSSRIRMGILEAVEADIGTSITGIEIAIPNGVSSRPRSGRSAYPDASQKEKQGKGGASVSQAPAKRWLTEQRRAPPTEFRDANERAAHGLHRLSGENPKALTASTLAVENPDGAPVLLRQFVLDSSGFHIESDSVLFPNSLPCFTIVCALLRF